MRKKIVPAVCAAAAVFTLAGCTPPAAVEVAAESSASASDPLQPAGIPAVDEPTELAIGFIAPSRGNNFYQATFTGISEYAEAHNATAEFIDYNFDPAAMVSQIQDAVTTERFDVLVIQATDGQAAIPAVQRAIDADITVVAEFFPIGDGTDVPGLIQVVDPAESQAPVLTQMTQDACASLDSAPCQVAYLEASRTIPLDVERTGLVVDALEDDPDVEVVGTFEGGLTSDQGRTAMQNVIQAHPDVDVVVGLSQAIAGAATVPGAGDVLFIGNGGSTQAFTAVQNGDWFATYPLMEKTEGEAAAALGLAAARGAEVPAMTWSRAYAVNGGIGDQAALDGLTAEYDD